ncbi:MULTISPECIES: recombinase family protein [unclassified Streptomyces]|uniref:recombinase family protein n=1 Tax=unclassified Streptomyces TaxID=2593676 RepID=UPI001F0433C9|nr:MULTISPECIES: recombinase family protein [unclassified Streptomyces]MCH0567263.1 recombinase family protein [Streptomyces sp. MUM 2J]MCH0571865.1 recombinase family protein [Streptomyces sp. MUM 136J]
MSGISDWVTLRKDSVIVMNHPEENRESMRMAIYLRCHPYDQWEMSTHRNALLRYAREMGVSEPAVFFDNGSSSREARPFLEWLIQSVDHGDFNIVLIPGPFVFSIDDLAARAVITYLQDAGCHVLELPSRSARAVHHRRPSWSA